MAATRASWPADHGVKIGEPSISPHVTALTKGHKKRLSQGGIRLRCLKAIIEREPLTSEEVDIISAFDCAMQSEAEEDAAEAALRIDALIPPLNEVRRVEDWLHNMWCLMIDFVMSPESKPFIQERLMSVLKHLRKLDRGKIKNRGIMKGLWVDLPGLNYALHPCFYDPTDSYSVAFTPESVNTWLNITTFAARLLSADFCCFDREAVVVLRRALETQPVKTKGFTECRIKAACAWITYGARPLRQWALENVEFTDMLLDTDLAASPEFVDEWRALILPAGPLYDGPGTMCLHRWEFWIKRFEEIGTTDSFISQEARRAARHAARSMRALEKNMENTLPA